MKLSMTIDIICPLYNAEKYIKDLDAILKKQKNVEIKNINYLLTESKDNTENILKELNCKYEIIKKQEFSHSLTREKAAKKCTADILVFITQDIHILNENWLHNLVGCIENGECVASYSRQICSNKTIEKYTREKNYPEKSFITSEKDIEKMGLKVFFSSDASAAIKRDIFIDLNGYDGKDLAASEDMYITYKIITNGYKVKYCADSVVEHSHVLTLKQLYDRYYNIGAFFKENKFFNNYKVGKAGGGLALYVLKRAIQDKNIKAIIRFVPDMSNRLIAKKMGEHFGKRNVNKK